MAASKLRPCAKSVIVDKEPAADVAAMPVKGTPISKTTDPKEVVEETPVILNICLSSIVKLPTLTVAETPVISAGPNSKPNVPTAEVAAIPDTAPAGPNSKPSVPKFAVAS